MNLIHHFKNYNERELWSLVVGGLFCGIYLFYLLIYSPLINAVATNTAQLQEKRETLVWMKKIEQQYQQPNKAAKPINTSKLLSLVATELNQDQFKAFPYQMQQTGSGDIQLTFEKIPYNLILNWLFEITHHYVIHIKEVHVERGTTPGIVKLSLIIFP